MKTLLTLVASIALALAMMPSGNAQLNPNPTASAVITGSESCSSLTNTCSYSIDGHHTSLLPGGLGELSGNGATDACGITILNCQTHISGSRTYGGTLCAFTATATTENILGPGLSDSSCW